MNRVNEAAKAKMIGEFARAAELGHDVNNLIAVRQSKTQTGWSSVCSCGWASNPKKRKVVGLGLAYNHVLEVITGQIPPSEMRGEIPAGIDGVSCTEIVGGLVQPGAVE